VRSIGVRLRQEDRTSHNLILRKLFSGTILAVLGLHCASAGAADAHQTRPRGHAIRELAPPGIGSDAIFSIERGTRANAGCILTDQALLRFRSDRQLRQP
jgi:hypothetical protein